MRVFAIILICILAGVSCQNKPHYTINGNISGKSDGMRVFLNKVDYPEPVKIDSTVIENGRFLFEGVVNEPGLYSIEIDKTGKGQPFSERNMTKSTFYLENSSIVFSGNIDSLTTAFWTLIRNRLKLKGL